VGLTVANVHFDDHSNDIAMHGHAYVWRRAIHEAVGATRTFPTSPYPSTRNPGTNRMSENPGVEGRWGQTHDIANPFTSEGSRFTTGRRRTGR